MKLTVIIGRVDKNYTSGLNRLPRIGILTFHSLPGARGGGGVLPITAYTGRLRPKGYLFQASGITKDREFCPPTPPLS